jgi:hypothetical protein
VVGGLSKKWCRCGERLTEIYINHPALLVFLDSKTPQKSLFGVFVYYESINRELYRRPMYECRCDERLKTKAEGSTRLAYTGLLGGLEHLKIETRLIDSDRKTLLFIMN